MRARTTRWVAGCAAVASFALVAGALALAYVNRDLAPAGLMMWNPSDVFGQVVSLAVPLVGLRPCFPAAREPDRLAVPCGGPGAGAAELFGAVRAACPDRGPRVVAGGPGLRLAVQLDLGDPPGHALLRVPALPNRAAALTAVASGRMVRGRGVHADRGEHAGESHPHLGAPGALIQSGGKPTCPARAAHPATGCAGGQRHCGCGEVRPVDG
jgi:hypothetical protein